MGNGVGKGIGVVAAAAVLQVIPVAGQIASAAIVTGAVVGGSVVDAVVDKNKQNDQADKNAAAQKQTTTTAADDERKRLAREAAQKQREVDEKKKKADAKAKSDAAELAKKNEKERKRLEAEQRQLQLLTNALESCRAGTIDQLPAIFADMKKDIFDNFKARAIAVCTTADARQACTQAIRVEERRRNPRPANAPRA